MNITNTHRQHTCPVIYLRFFFFIVALLFTLRIKQSCFRYSRYRNAKMSSPITEIDSGSSLPLAHSTSKCRISCNDVFVLFFYLWSPTCDFKHTSKVPAGRGQALFTSFKKKKKKKRKRCGLNVLVT